MEWSNADTFSALAVVVSTASAIYAYKTYRATVDLKKHDFSLELQRNNETLRAGVRSLEALLADANKSRRSVLSAQDLAASSAWQQWKVRHDALQAEIRALTHRLPPEQHFERLGLKDLTGLITATHGFQARVDAVRAELEAVLIEDKCHWREKREDYRSLAAGYAARPTQVTKTLGDR